MPKRSLKWMLVLRITAVMVFTIICLGLTAVQISVSAIMSEIKAKNRMLTEVLVTRIDEYLRLSEEKLDITRRLIERNADQTDIIQTILDEVRSPDGFFVQILVLNAERRVIALSPYDEASVPVNLSERRGDMNTGTEKKTSWSPVMISPRSNHPVVTVSMPLGDGMIAGHLSIRKLGDTIRNIKSDCYIAVTDQTGTFIAHTDETLVQQRAYDANYTTVKNHFRKEFLTKCACGHEKNMICQAGFIPRTEWAVSVYQAEEDVFQPVRRIYYLFVLGGSAAIVMAVLLSLAHFRSLINALEHFIRQTETIADGDYSDEITEVKYLEFRRLASRFGKMASVVRTREEKIMENERAFRAVFHTKAAGMSVVDLEGFYKRMNQTWSHITGYRPEELQGRKHTDLILSDDLPEVLETMYSLMKGEQETARIENRIFRKNGEILWVDNSVSVMREEGSPRYFLWMSADSTDRKKAEIENIRLRQYLSDIIDSMPSLIAVVSPEGLITMWNTEAERLTDVSARDAMGKPFGSILPRFSDEILRIWKDFRTGAARRKEKISRMIGDKVLYYEVTVFPLTSGDEGFAVIRVDDVTEKTRIEEMMIQTEKMMSVGGLAAGMAHEINNPLGGILQSAQNIIRRLSPELKANLKTAENLGVDLDSVRAYLTERGIFRFLDTIREAGDRSGKIVNNMLQFSRRGNSRFAPVNLAELADAAVELAAHDYDLKKKYDFRHIEIIREYDADLPDVTCVSTEIEQVILNLLRNAAQAMAETKDAEGKSRLIIRLYREGEFARIEVEDNGPGVRYSDQKRLFEPFYTTKEPGVGTGLGLSVSYFIITSNHSGRMFAESAPGKGTTFIILIPIQKKFGADSGEKTVKSLTG